MNDKICYIELECRWLHVILINGYASTEDKEEEVKYWEFLKAEG